MIEWVTSLFEGEDRELIGRVFPIAADAVEAMLKGDYDAAAGLFNGRTVG
jgi:hypothetical protein